jgi:glycerol-3-phosphate acyltransferase PlsY
MMEYLIAGMVSYLMGSIPFGFVLTKIFLKKDIREIGSGNIGATNALRTGSKLIGYTTLILDIAKAIIPVIYVKINFPELIYIASLCAFLGHVFPIWLKFKGGKGVATYVGILFSINILLGVVFVASWGLVFLIFKYSSLSSIIGALSIPVYLLITNETNSVVFFTIMFVLIFFTHRENIKRLKNKEESKTKIY